MIGRRLKMARKAAGLSLRDLAEAMQERVSAQAIGKYERNEDMPSSGVLLALSESLGAPVDYLLSPNVYGLHNVEIPRALNLDEHEESSVKFGALFMTEQYLSLEEALGLATYYWDPSSERVLRADSVEEAEAAAAEVRGSWNVGIGPILSLSELLEGRGIKIFETSLSSIDCLTAYVQRDDGIDIPVLVVSSGLVAERKRLALAHELAHLVLAIENKRTTAAIASRFAGAFMLPAEALWEQVGRKRTNISTFELNGLRTIFGISIQAAASRCRELGIVAANWIANAWAFNCRDADQAKLGEQDQGGFRSAHLERPQRMKRLCLRALDEGVLGLARVAELLSVPAQELVEGLNGPALGM